MRIDQFGGLLLTVLFASSSLTGCHHNSRKTMTDLWHAPQRWTGRIEIPAIAEKNEPSVSANNAATAVAKAPEAEQFADETAGKAVVQVADSSETSRPNQGSVPAKSDALVTLEFNDSASDLEPLVTSSPQSVFTDSSAEQLERLQAAINDDAKRADTPSRIANGGHDVRLRVESMLEKSRRLFDLGQLREARHTAKIAQEIGDSARLDFSPEEERPVDLVQRIEDHIRGEEDANAAPTETAAAPVSTEEKSFLDDKRLAANEQEIANRQRRDWSGLAVFRRDRKLADQDGTGTAKKSSVVQLSLDGDRATTEEPDGAVVQANRSVSISRNPVQTNSNSSVTFPAESEPVEPTELQSNQEPADEPPEFTNPVAIADIDSPEGGVNPAWTGDRLKPPGATDEDSPPPADFDESRPISAFREINSPPQTSLKTPENSSDDRPAGWGTYIAATLFSVCAAAAVFWYRRGAT
ncbi:MAG: hypothetical protein U0941_13795 [Planctomycetaceae bacterium]